MPCPTRDRVKDILGGKFHLQKKKKKGTAASQGKHELSFCNVSSFVSVVDSNQPQLYPIETDCNWSPHQGPTRAQSYSPPSGGSVGMCTSSFSVKGAIPGEEGCGTAWVV